MPGVTLRAQSLLLGAFVTFALLAGTLLISRGLGRINATVASKPVYDLVVDWKGARAFIEGYNPYSPEGQRRAELTATGLGHPPTTLFWIVPLARFPLKIAREVLLQVSLLLLLIELILMAREFRVPAAWPSAWLTFGLVLSCDWIDYLLFLGQISQLIAFAYFLAWYCLRRGWDARAGLAVGAACTLKAFPGVLLLFLALARRWRALAAAAALYLAVAAVMTARFGFLAWPQFVQQLHGDADRWMASIQNQAIHGMVLRFFNPVCEPRGPTLPLATAISTIGALALLGGVAWLARNAGQTRERIDLPFALAAVLSVFTSNWAWEHYNVLFILPVVTGLTYLWRLRGRRGLGSGWTVVAATLLGLVLVTLPVPILEKANLQSAYLQHPELHFRLHFFEALNMVPVIGLTLSLAVLLWRSERQVAAQALAVVAAADQPPAAGGPGGAVPAAAALARAARRASRSA
ncbi:MAG: glycosyltransferase family 87 protein [Polyangia bacterium]